MNRPLTGILLFLCFVAPLATHYLALRYQQKLVRREIKRKMMTGIDKAELVQLQFSEADQRRLLRWEHSREFAYKGQMYDVVYSCRTGDTTTYWLWWDHEETRLNRQLNRWAVLALAGSPGQQEKAQRVMLFFKTLFCSAPAAVAAELSPAAMAIRPGGSGSYACSPAPPPSPPPERPSNKRIFKQVAAPVRGADCPCIV